MPRDNEWLFTIYKQNPVGTRFVQMVSKTPEWEIQLGSVRTIYKICSSLPRESGGRQNHGGMQMVNTFSIWKFCLGILDYLSRNHC